jgi:hypothetical protein
MTTYGVWLRGDRRRWVDQGRILPADPVLEASDRERMKHSEFLFERDHLLEIGSMIGRSLRERMQLRILALCARQWHVHFVIAATERPLAAVVKCAKDAVRWGLRLHRPIWGEDYDKRFCFDERSVLNRIEYVERHNLAAGWSARPWDFIEDWRQLI